MHPGASIHHIALFSITQLATNLRDAINNWNMGTNQWLRMVVYERVPRKYGTTLTFGVSALWHGFYAGYYITFATGALILSAARVVSKSHQCENISTSMDHRLNSCNLSLQSTHFHSQARKLFRHRFQHSEQSRGFYDILTVLTTRVFMGYFTFPFILLEFKVIFSDTYTWLLFLNNFFFNFSNILKNHEKKTNFLWKLTIPFSWFVPYRPVYECTWIYSCTFI